MTRRAARERGGDLRREQRNGRGDIGRAGIHAREHQRRQGDKGAAARKRILDSRPQRREEQHDQGHQAASATLWMT